jgi:glycosyltransferase involved in cell wall biosynthesis
MAEALAGGRPVAAPRAGGALEIVDRTCGVLYEPGSAEAAAAALVEVTQRAAELSGPARERAERLFDRRVSQRRFRELVDEVTAGR